MGGASCIFFSIFSAVGGWSGMHEQLASLPDPVWSEQKGWINQTQPPEEALSQPLSNWLHISQFNNPKEHTPPLVLIAGWIIIGLGYYTVNHTQTMRLMGARSLWDMKMAALLGGALSIPLMLMVVLLGIFGRILYPDLASGDQKADVLIPLMAKQHLAVGLKGLVAAGIISATISTFDSMGSALSALFTRDIYARWLRPNQSDRHYLKVSRWATIGILSIGFLYLPFIINQRNMVDATLTLVSVFVTPLFTIYLLGALTRVHPKSGLIGLLVGGTFGILCFLLRLGIINDAIPFTVPYAVYGQWYAYPWSVLITAATMLLTTVIHGLAPKDIFLQKSISTAVDHPSTTNWLTTSTEQLPTLRQHPFKNNIPLLCQPRWYALLLIATTTWLIMVYFW